MEKLSEADALLIEVYLKNNMVQKAISLGYQPDEKTLEVLNAKTLNDFNLSESNLHIYIQSFLNVGEKQVKYFQNLRSYLYRKNLYAYFFLDEINKHLNEKEALVIKKEISKRIHSSVSSVELFIQELTEVTDFKKIPDVDFVKKYENILNPRDYAFALLVSGNYEESKTFYQISGSKTVPMFEVDLATNLLYEDHDFETARKIIFASGSMSRLRFLLSKVINENNQVSDIERTIASNIIELKKQL